MLLHSNEYNSELAKSRELFPEIRTFERWLKTNMPVFEGALAIAAN